MTYLTEKLLGEFLHSRVSDDFVTNRTVPNSGKIFRPDFRSEKLKLIVEFDGFRHYQFSSIVIGDAVRDKLFADMGYTVVRIPYFVQLDSRVVNFLFAKYVGDCSGYSNYPHGFIDDKALLPADFCYLGEDRFIKDLAKFDFLKEDVKNSLREKFLNKGDWRLVCSPRIMEELKL